MMCNLGLLFTTFAPRKRIPEHLPLNLLICNSESNGGAHADVARGTLNGMDVAVKTPRLCYKSAEQYQRSCREADMMRTAAHEFVLPILSTFTIDEPEPRLSIVLPWCSNEGLNKYLQRDLESERAIGGDQLLRLLLQVSKALCYIHYCNIVHNGIHPTNILVTSAGDVRLSGFSNSSFVGSTVPNVYISGGHWGYQSPQKHRHSWQVDEADLGLEEYMPYPSDDMYAFGTLIYVLYADHHPFGPGGDRLTNYIAAQRMVDGERPPRPSPDSCRRVPLPDALWALIQGCWEDEPSARPTAKDALSVLESETVNF